jgi:hypothetical protein
LILWIISAYATSRFGSANLSLLLASIDRHLASACGQRKYTQVKHVTYPSFCLDDGRMAQVYRRASRLKDDSIFKSTTQKRGSSSGVSILQMCW